MFIVAAAVVLAAPRAGIAQEKSTAQLVPLKLQLVISRHTGEKKISSLPYTLWITANKPGETSLRMGVEVPVVASRFSPKAGEVAPSYNYRPVGTNIEK